MVLSYFINAKFYKPFKMLMKRRRIDSLSVALEWEDYRHNIIVFALSIRQLLFTTSCGNTKRGFDGCTMGVSLSLFYNKVLQTLNTLMTVFQREPMHVFDL